VVFKKIIRLVQFIFRMTTYRPNTVGTLVCMLGLAAFCSYALLFCHVITHRLRETNFLLILSRPPYSSWRDLMSFVRMAIRNFDLNRI
jgi:hypothetical protein